MKKIIDLIKALFSKGNPIQKVGQIIELGSEVKKDIELVKEEIEEIKSNKRGRPSKEVKPVKKTTAKKKGK